MFELPDPLAESVMLRGLFMLAAAKEVNALVVESRMVAGEVPVIRTSR